jgi:hypothetical protein
VKFPVGKYAPTGFIVLGFLKMGSASRMVGVGGVRAHASGDVMAGGAGHVNATPGGCSGARCRRLGRSALRFQLSSLKGRKLA